MQEYFFLAETLANGTENDTVKAIAKAYSAGGFQIYYGSVVAVGAIEAAEAPDIAEDIVMLSRQEVIDLIRSDLPNFDGQEFIDAWDNRGNI